MVDPAQEPAPSLVLEVTAVTHQGKVRAHNEDTIAVDRWLCGDSMAAPRQFTHDLAEPRLLLVADGMGGHVGGRQASRRAAEAMVRLNAQDGEPLDATEALRTVNREIFEAAANDPALRGMGTTIAGMVAMADRTVWFNVGDSRIYSVRAKYLRQLSVDDVPAGAAAHSGRITQALGGADSFLEIQPHVGAEPIRPGRRYLLCSDGLTDALSLEAMEGALTSNALAVVQELLERALAAGAPDNVSIVLATVGASSAAAAERTQPNRNLDRRSTDG